MKALEILKFMQICTSNKIDEVDEAIKELEELENRSCDSCIHFTIYKGEYGVCKIGVNNKKMDCLHNSFSCNIWEPK